jgi:hypothetical protein
VSEEKTSFAIDLDNDIVEAIKRDRHLETNHEVRQELQRMFDDILLPAYKGENEPHTP